MVEETKLLETGKVPGTPVYGTDRVQIGDVDELVIDTTSGQVRYAILSFGGLLGIGRTQYVVPWLSLKWHPELQGYITGITQAQLEASPEKTSWNDRSWEKEVHSNYGAPGYWEPQLMGRT